MPRKQPGGPPAHVAEMIRDLTERNWTAQFAGHVRMLEVEGYVTLAVEAVQRLAAVLPAKALDDYDRLCDAVLLMALAIKVGATGDRAGFSEAIARVGTPQFLHDAFTDDLRELMRTLSPRAYKIFNDALARGVPMPEAFALAEEGRYPMRAK